MSATLSTATKRPRAFFRLLSNCYDGITVYFARRAAIATLNELDDRTLRDIGLARSQIEAAACGFITRSGQARMIASSAATGPRADGRQYASTVEAVPWS